MLNKYPTKQTCSVVLNIELAMVHTWSHINQFITHGWSRLFQMETELKQTLSSIINTLIYKSLTGMNREFNM
jgi:hypothetical protein